MKPWRVTVVDSLFHRVDGFAVVLADSADEARAAVEKYFEGYTAYARPYEVSGVELLEHLEPHVAEYWTGSSFPPPWPPKRDYSDDELGPQDDSCPKEHWEATGRTRFAPALASALGYEPDETPPWLGDFAAAVLDALD